MTTTVQPPAAPDPYLAMLDRWADVSARKKALEEEENDLRRMLFAGAFPNAKEGVNKHKLPDGRTIKGDMKINRKLDEAALPATLAAMRDAGVANADALVRYKPELAKREWNALSDENKLLFSKAVIAVPGMPTLEIIPAPVKDA